MQHSSARPSSSYALFSRASLFYLAVLIVAAVNISFSSVYLSSKLDDTLAAPRERRLPREFDDRTGIRVFARKFVVSKQKRNLVGTFGYALASVTDDEGPELAANYSSYWEVQVKNDRWDDVYIDLAVDSTDAEPRNAWTKEVADTTARTQRQVSVDGKTRTITQSVIRVRDVPRRAITPVLAFWADNGKEDTFDFAAEFSVHVEPPKQCEGCSNITQAIHDAFVQLLGRVPDQSGLSHYHAQLTGNHSKSIQQIRRNIASSKEAKEYRRRLATGYAVESWSIRPVPPLTPELATSWPTSGCLSSGVAVGGRKIRTYRQLLSNPPSLNTHYTAAHGLHFEVEAREWPIVITGIRFSALAQYMRGRWADTSEVRLMMAHSSRQAHRQRRVDGMPSKDWQLLGQHYGPVPAAPQMAIIHIPPLHLAPHERVSLCLHADHPFGVSVSMPAIAQMAGEVRTRDRKGLWQQLVAPDWLQLAFGRDTTGLLQDEGLNVIPGALVGQDPFTLLMPHTPAAFVGSILYSPGAEHGTSKLASFVEAGLAGSEQLGMTGHVESRWLNDPPTRHAVAGSGPGQECFG